MTKSNSTFDEWYEALVELMYDDSIVFNDIVLASQYYDKSYCVIDAYEDLKGIKDV